MLRQIVVGCQRQHVLQINIRQLFSHHHSTSYVQLPEEIISIFSHLYRHYLDNVTLFVLRVTSTNITMHLKFLFGPP